MLSCCHFTDVYRWELCSNMQDPTTHLCCFFFLHSFILGWYLWVSPSNWQFPHHFALLTQNEAWRPHGILLSSWACDLWDVNSERPPWRQLGLRHPVTTEAGKPSWHREDRDPLGPPMHTCSMVLLHTDVKFLLRELRSMIIHILDPDVDNQGSIHDVSC